MPLVPPEAATPALERFAARALAHLGEPADRTVHLVQFGDLPAMQDELAALVVAGEKRATAASLWELEAAGEPLPQPGDLLLVTDSRATPVCLTRTVQVDVVPFDEVTAEFAHMEGEALRQIIAAYFSRIPWRTKEVCPST